MPDTRHQDGCFWKTLRDFGEKGFKEGAGHAQDDPVGTKPVAAFVALNHAVRVVLQIAIHFQ